MPRSHHGRLQLQAFAVSEILEMKNPDANGREHLRLCHIAARHSHQENLLAVLLQVCYGYVTGKCAPQGHKSAVPVRYHP